jgi:hypothetical protein
MNAEAALPSRPADALDDQHDTARPGRKPSAAQLLGTRGALLSRGHLAELGLGRRQVDAVFETLDVIVFPGSRRPLVRVEDYLSLIEKSTYGTDRVRG